jgi:formylglycine-generating enzyme required for sulfatase activity
VILGQTLPVRAVPGLAACSASLTSASRGCGAGQGRTLEGGGEALSDLEKPPAGIQEDGGLPHQGDGARPGPGAPLRKPGEPISQPWGVSSVRLLGALEIDVIDRMPGAEDETGKAPEPLLARELPLADVKGFGPMARAAFVALVLNLKSGRTPAQLGEAMEGRPETPLALQTHLSAVRRTGLRVSHRSRIYRVEGLDRAQVDALRFEDLYRELKRLTANPGEERDLLLIMKAEEALQLWGGDPLAAHQYFMDHLTLRQFSDWLIEIQRWYASALLRRAGPADIESAARLLEQIRARNPSHRGVAELQEAIRALSSASPAAGPGNAGPRAFTGDPGDSAWLPRYRECLRELASSVDLRGFSIEILSSSSLAAVYTPLYAKPRTLEKPSPGRRTSAGRPLLETVVGHTRANLVIGESGSGKSTFLLHLCTSHLDDESEGLPLFVDLGASPPILEDRLDSHGRLPWHVLPELFSSCFADLGVDVSVQDLDALARRTRVVWLVDGLNEFPSPEMRSALADAISVCTLRWPKAQFVITTTHTALSGHGTPPGFQRVDVDEFHPADVEFFLDAFSRDRNSKLTAEERRESWEPLARAVRSSADLRDMAKSPLRLTAMTLAYLREGRLPESRADLLRGAVSWLIHKKSPLLRPYVRSGHDLKMIFAELAFQMMAAEETPLSRVGIAWAADRLRPLDCYHSDVRDFLDAAVSAGGLLIPRGPGDLGMHDAFRDYLAASRIAAKTDDVASGWWSEMAPHLDDSEWHSVVALVPGALLLLSGSERVDLFFDRLGASCANQRLGTRAARVSLGGRILHELGLSGYRLSRAPRWADAVRSVRELFDNPGDVPLVVRYGAAVAYGIMGDDRLAHPEGTWAPIPGGRFWMGAQAAAPRSRNYDPDAAPWESPVSRVELPSFAIRKFPITVSEYRAFVDAGGYSGAGARHWPAGGWQWRTRARAEAPVEWEAQLSVPNTPVSGVTWYECMAYCGWLTENDDRDNTYRLPYEREWEYVAKRDISSSQFRWGDRMQGGNEAEANWAGAFLRHKTPVGMFPASTTSDGVADLFGNVEEWCMDTWPVESSVRAARPAAAGSLQQDARSPADGAQPGTMRVVRGGSCIRFSRLCRPTYRSRVGQDSGYLSVGFRPVRMSGPGNEPRRATRG